MSLVRYVDRIHCARRLTCKYSTDSTINNGIVNPVVYNRNPRNLERLRIALKPYGYELQKGRNDFWHKVVLEQGSRSITASIVHLSGKTVIEASTNEWAIKKFLYRPTDTAAYINLGRVFAQRCLESGITEVTCTLEDTGEKVGKFVSELEKSGLRLQESPRYCPWRPWGNKPQDKPWEVAVEVEK